MQRHIFLCWRRNSRLQRFNASYLLFQQEKTNKENHNCPIIYGLRRKIILYTKSAHGKRNRKSMCQKWRTMLIALRCLNIIYFANKNVNNGFSYPMTSLVLALISERANKKTTTTIQAFHSIRIERYLLCLFKSVRNNAFYQVQKKLTNLFIQR